MEEFTQEHHARWYKMATWRSLSSLFQTISSTQPKPHLLMTGSITVSSLVDFMSQATHPYCRFVSRPESVIPR